MCKKILCLVISLICFILCAAPVLAASDGRPQLQYWNNPSTHLQMEDPVNEAQMGEISFGKSLTLTTEKQKYVIGRSNYFISGFYVSGDTAVYYAENEKGKSKWFTYNIKTGASKEYAYDYLSPFWADSDGIYSTTGGKRVYDYNIYRFDPKTGKKTKLAAVYGMPIGYTGGYLIALDFYHDQLRYYQGSKLARKIDADMLGGFIVADTVYLILQDGVYRVNNRDALERVIGIYTYPQAYCNGSALLYHSGLGYPTDVYLINNEGVKRLGAAKNAKELISFRAQAIEQSKIK